MFAFIWLISLVVLSNTVYQICSKSMPLGVHPFASLTVTYLVGAVLSGIMFFILNPGGNLLREYGKLNWAPFALGIVIVGLEVGFGYAYKAGWQVSTASVVQNAFLAVMLVLVGVLLYREHISWSKLVGIGLCLVGLGFIGLKK